MLALLVTFIVVQRESMHPHDTGLELGKYPRLGTFPHFNTSSQDLVSPDIGVLFPTGSYFGLVEKLDVDVAWDTLSDLHDDYLIHRSRPSSQPAWMAPPVMIQVLVQY